MLTQRIETTTLTILRIARPIPEVRRWHAGRPVLVADVRVETDGRPAITAQAVVDTEGSESGACRPSTWDESLMEHLGTLTTAEWYGLDGLLSEAAGNAFAIGSEFRCAAAVTADDSGIDVVACAERYGHAVVVTHVVFRYSDGSRLEGEARTRRDAHGHHVPDGDGWLWCDLASGLRDTCSAVPHGEAPTEAEVIAAIEWHHGAPPRLPVPLHATR